MWRGDTSDEHRGSDGHLSIATPHRVEVSAILQVLVGVGGRQELPLQGVVEIGSLVPKGRDGLPQLSVELGGLAN